MKTHARTFSAVALVTLVAILSPLAPSAKAANYFIAQSALGSGNGNDVADSASVAFFNNPSSWSSAPGTSGKISPGDTVELEGVISTALTFQGSGQPGKLITLLFDKGAV